MNFVQAVQTCLKKYVDFSGRASRSEFWWFFLAQIILLMVAMAIDEMVYMVVALGLLLPGLGVAVRRMHDVSKSGWFVLLGLIPLIGFFILLYFWVKPSDGPNQYGDAPAGGEPAALPPGAV